MLITTTQRPALPVAKPQTETLTSPQAETGSQMKRPVAESWTVGDKAYQSTEDLLAQSADLENAWATYRYRAQDEPTPLNAREKVQNVIGNAGLGAAGGAAAGAVVGGGLSVLAGLGSLLSAIAGGGAQHVSNSLLWAPVMIGATLGAVAGGVYGFGKEAPVEGGAVVGQLTKNAHGAAFYPQGKVAKKVDLQEFVKAPVPDSKPAQEPKSEPLKNAALGALAAAASPAALFLPLIGPFVMPGVGAAIGSQVDQRTSLGTTLGLAAGIGITSGGLIALPAYFQTGNAVPLMALTGGLALAGAVLGNKVITELNTESSGRTYGQQWWNEPPPDANR